MHTTEDMRTRSIAPSIAFVVEICSRIEGGKQTMQGDNIFLSEPYLLICLARDGGTHEKWLTSGNSAEVFVRHFSLA